MTIACFWWGMFTKTWIFKLAQVSCNVIMDFLLPDIPLNKFMHEDKCCTLGLGCCLNRALFRRLLLAYIIKLSSLPVVAL